MEDNLGPPIVTLISPQKLGSHSSDFYIGRGGAPPLNLAYLSRALKNNNIAHQIVDALASTNVFKSESNEFFIHGLTHDQVVSKIDPSTKIVGISSMFTSEFLIIRELAGAIKKAFPEIVIVLGGEHATAMASAILKYEENIDFVLLGESEESFPIFIDVLLENKDLSLVPGLCFKDITGEIKQNERNGRILDLDNFLPLWDFIPVDFYTSHKLSLSRVNLKGMPILATRGCPYKCTFCSNEQMWGTRYVMRSIPSIIKEMKYDIERFGVEHFDFLDLSTSINKKWFKSLLESLINELPGITWEMSVGTRSEILDEEILLLLMKSGTTQITYAPESGSQKISKMIKKQLNLSKMYNSVKIASEIGLEVKSNTIIGFPNENFWDLLQTIWMGLKLGWYGTKNVCIFVFSAYPGSQLFDDKYQVNQLSELEYENYIQYYTVNTAGARIFDVTEIFKYPREQFYTLVGNVVTVLSYFLCSIRRPYMIKNLFKNIVNGQPKGPVEQGLFSLIQKMSPQRWRRIGNE